MTPVRVGQQRAATPVEITTTKAWQAPPEASWELWERDRTVPHTGWSRILRYTEMFVRHSRTILTKLQPHYEFRIVSPGSEPPA
jgi:hypothetical protein